MVDRRRMMWCVLLVTLFSGCAGAGGDGGTPAADTADDRIGGDVADAADIPSPPDTTDLTADAPPADADADADTGGTLIVPPTLFGYAGYDFEPKDMDPALADLLQAWLDGGPEGAQAWADARGLQLWDGQLQVMLRSEGRLEGLPTAGDLVEAGGTVLDSYGDITWFALPFEGLQVLTLSDPLEFLDNIWFPKTLEVDPLPDLIDPSVFPDWALQATDMLSCLQGGTTGKGVKIAVFEGGFKWAPELIQDGLLPASAQILPPKDLPDDFVQSSHGTAVAQIIHRAAPDAELYLMIVPNDEVVLNRAVDYCIDNGIDVINASWGRYNQSFYDGGGPTAKAVRKAWDNGIVWVNASGNSAAGKHWHGGWVDADKNGTMELSPGLEHMTFTLKEEERVGFFLSWDAWPTVGMSGLSLCIESSGYWHGNPGEIFTKVDCSKAPKMGRAPITDMVMVRGENPCEEQPDTVMCLNDEFRLSIRAGGMMGSLLSPEDGTLMSLFASPKQGGFALSGAMADGSLVDPAVVEEIISVGAVHQEDWDSGVLAPYSSFGPTNGGIQKPELVGPSGVQVAFTNSAKGTSFSAPYVAAAAALLLQRSQDLTPDEVKQLLIDQALPIGQSLPAQGSGYGKLHLDCCALNCLDRECGDDGCGGSCGTCGEGTHCFKAFACVAEGNGCDDDCDDGDPCSEDICLTNGECIHAPLPDGAPCNDAGAWACEEGLCVCTTTCGAKQCGADGCGGSCGTCDDAIGCTLDICDLGAGTCSNLADDDACDNGDPCTAGVCDTGAGGCVFPEPIGLCDDGIACTEDDCVPMVGCLPVPVDAACDDGIECTADHCDAGEGCVQIPMHGLCDDGDDCTNDLCHPAQGCVHAPAMACGGGLVVTSTADPGDGICDAAECTLREALDIANLIPGKDLVAFDIAGPGPHVIALATPLPVITGPVVIDGTTEPDWQGAPVVRIHGAALPAGSNGLHVTAGDSTIRGLSVTGFGGQIAAGILLEGGSGSLVEGNYVGLACDGEADIGNYIGVRIKDSSENLIGGTGPGARNVVSGDHGGDIQNGSGVSVHGQSSLDNVISGNYIGTDATGMLPRLGFRGISVSGASGTLIGGVTPGSGNLVSGRLYGISVGNTSPNTQILGNRVGTDGTGEAPLPWPASMDPCVAGIQLAVTSDIIVGCADAGCGNVVAGLGCVGIDLSSVSDVIIQGNHIGVDVTGSVGQGNSGAGIFLARTQGVLIGGGGEGEGNLISDNWTGIVLGANDGIADDFNLGTVIQGNHIGTDAAGTADLGNTMKGILVEVAEGALVGGPGPGEGNLIVGNGSAEIQIERHDALGPVLQGNTIGADITGGPGIPAAWVGVHVNAGAEDALIGGTGEGEGNLIAYAQHTGVLISADAYGTPSGHAILGNRIHSNGDLGIDLRGKDEESGLVTANDPLDADSGPNSFQNHPLLLTAVLEAELLVTGILESAPGLMYRLEFFASDGCDPESGHGEGAESLGHHLVITDALGSAPFAAPLPAMVEAGAVVTATATVLEITGDDFLPVETSEFSACVPVVGSCTPDCDGMECGTDGCGGSCGDCDDDLICTTDTCDGTSCVFTPVLCDDGIECTEDSCGEIFGCLPFPDDDACDDDDPCTIDHCDIESGCQHGPAEDGTGCGAGMECVSGACTPVCSPSCVNKECGDDGCGGSCGTCGPGTVCAAGACLGAEAPYDELLIPEDSDFAQWRQDICALENGQVLVVWHSQVASVPGPEYAVRGRILASPGIPVTGEFEISTPGTTEAASNLGCAAVPGGFVVAWGRSDLHWSAFSLDGTRTGGPWTEDSVLTMAVLHVAGWNDGAVSVTFRDWNGTRLMELGADGVAGANIQLSGNDFEPMDLVSDGTASTWVLMGPQGLAVNEIRRYSRTGALEAGPTALSADAAVPMEARLARLGTGDLLVAYNYSGTGAVGSDIGLSRFGPTLDATFRDLIVNVFTESSQSSPIPIPMVDGGYVVAWESDGLEGILCEGVSCTRGIYARWFNASNQPYGPGEVHVNQVTPHLQEHPVGAEAYGVGDILIAWDSWTDGTLNGRDVRGRWFEPDTFMEDPCGDAGCDDGDPCTEDICVPVAGCQFTPLGDGDWCSPGHQCQGGVCTCVPDCGGGYQCGDDGCGGSCGTCDPGYECQFWICVCVPDCSGKTCGSDGCQGSCGACEDSDPCTVDTCADDACVFTSTDDGAPCGGGAFCRPEGCGKAACDGETPCPMGFECAAGSCEITADPNDEFMADHQTAPDHEKPMTCALSDGNGLVIWLARLEVAPGVPEYRLRGRIFDPSGIPVTGELDLSNGQKASNYNNSIGCIAMDGWFATFWLSGTIYGSRWTNAGENLIPVDTVTPGSGVNAYFTHPWDDGHIGITYRTNVGGIYFLEIDDGLDAVFLDALGTGGLLGAVSDGVETVFMLDGDDIWRFGRDGTYLSGPVPVTDYSGIGYPAVAHLTGGDLLVTYQVQIDGAIKGRRARFQPDLTPVFKDAPINPVWPDSASTFNQVASLADGGYVTTFSMGEQRAFRFEADDTPAHDPDVIINQWTTGFQRRAVPVQLTSGDVLVAWESDGMPAGLETDIGARIIALEEVGGALPGGP